ncbi:hypothetical protein LZ30DRAFT_129455 [Colletotrichum cereale]|nr:hypothetical protein LZ30DRAFT_129455 [Colletotrichum cereale]
MRGEIGWRGRPRYREGRRAEEGPATEAPAGRTIHHPSSHTVATLLLLLLLLLLLHRQRGVDIIAAGSALAKCSAKGDLDLRRAARGRLLIMKPLPPSDGSGISGHLGTSPPAASRPFVSVCSCRRGGGGKGGFSPKKPTKVQPLGKHFLCCVFRNKKPAPCAKGSCVERQEDKTSPFIGDPLDLLARWESEPDPAPPSDSLFRLSKP